jgi:isoleucyl-tRNA synthetase
MRRSKRWCGEGRADGRHNLEHKYPHCWRCHKPLIFRATEQWFISMETPVLSPKSKNGTTFRERALEEIRA